MGTRRAGALGGVSHTRVAGWRKWLDGGAKPEDLPEPEPGTLDGLRHYLRLRNDIEHRKAGLRLAADRLEEVAGDLRTEALRITPEDVRAAHRRLDAAADLRDGASDSYDP